MKTIDMTVSQQGGGGKTSSPSAFEAVLDDFRKYLNISLTSCCKGNKYEGVIKKFKKLKVGLSEILPRLFFKPSHCFLTFDLNRLKLKTVFSTSDICHTERMRSIPFYKDSSSSYAFGVNRTQNDAGEVLHSPLILDLPLRGLSKKGRGKNSEIFSTNFTGQRKIAFTLAEAFSTHFAGQRKAAFTLAEVLITLGIIGVVAAVTLPALTAKYQKVVLSSQAKKAYSNVQSIIRSAEAAQGEVSTWSEFDDNIRWCDRDGYKILVSYLAPKAKVTHIYTNGMNYKSGNEYGAFMCYTPGKTKLHISAQSTPTQYVYMNGLRWVVAGNQKLYSMSLADGSCICLNSTSINISEGILANIYIDSNGSDKGPNVVGMDLFIFRLMKNGQLLPDGYEKSINELTSSYCNLSFYRTDDKCTALLMQLNWNMNDSRYPWGLIRTKGTTVE